MTAFDPPLSMFFQDDAKRVPSGTFCLGSQPGFLPCPSMAKIGVTTCQSFPHIKSPRLFGEANKSGCGRGPSMFWKKSLIDWHQGMDAENTGLGGTLKGLRTPHEAPTRLRSKFDPNRRDPKSCAPVIRRVSSDPCSLASQDAGCIRYLVEPPPWTKPTWSRLNSIPCAECGSFSGVCLGRHAS